MVKLLAKKGGRNDYTYYLNIPREIAKSLGLKRGDRFELIVEQRDGELALVYKKVKK
ncbi:AbrB/MazE/SpoVT family DNA-binding domain-containing protein [Acidianus ambivalens]|uniref:AbrB/MazE/SpoVT family DNA-binding domain-containing protein n=1 Tax=Acidianus ambivalens TaxID=2283 RepID=A0A6G1T8G7_ACIAM|nr:AbrB/MazE/SpoVT family DNA-binding domain-containing protein [Acidianus ambivalens]MQL56610.1 AbrB/MazE/SpoVT family DNA-binding domain-containing protein [Acidianus ambivalens]